MAKIYTFHAKKSNSTEAIIPLINEVDDFDIYCDEYFDGSDIALSDDGQSVTRTFQIKVPCFYFA